VDLLVTWARQQVGKQVADGRLYGSRLVNDGCRAAGIRLAPLHVSRRHSLPATLGLLIRELGGSAPLVDEAMRMGWRWCEEAAGATPSALGFKLADEVIDRFFGRLPRTRAILAGGAKVREAVRHLLNSVVVGALGGGGASLTAAVTAELTRVADRGGADGFVRLPARPPYSPPSPPRGGPAGGPALYPVSRWLYDRVGFPITLFRWGADCAAAEIRSRQIYAEHMTDLQGVAARIARANAAPTGALPPLVSVDDLTMLLPVVLDLTI